jgi:CBS domain-containing protein
MAVYINGECLANIPVSTASSKQVIGCSPDDKIGDVEALMRTHQLHRLPVISDSYEPLGIVSLHDIALACKAGKRGIKAQEVSDTLAAICRPGAKALSVVGAVA